MKRENEGKITEDLAGRLAENEEIVRAIGLLDYYGGTPKSRESLRATLLLGLGNILLQLRGSKPVADRSSFETCFSAPRSPAEDAFLLASRDEAAESSEAGLFATVRGAVAAAHGGTVPVLGKKRGGFPVFGKFLLLLAAIALALSVGSVFSKRQREVRFQDFMRMKNEDAEGIRNLQSIRAALEKYHQRHSSYPNTNLIWQGVECCFGRSTPDWVPGLVPQFIPYLPQVQGERDCNRQYVYKSDGVSYKLIRHQPRNCELIKGLAPELIDPARDCWAYGYWSPEGRNF